MVDGPLFDDIPLDHIGTNFKKFANFFRELTLLDEKITELGSLDHAIKEANARFERATALEVELTTRYDQIVDEALAKVKEAEDQAKHVLNKARNKEAEILAAAVSKSEKITQDAQIAAQKIVDDAYTAHSAINTQIEDSVSRHDHLRSEIEKTSSHLVEITKKVTDKQAEHDLVVKVHGEFLSKIGVK